MAGSSVVGPFSARVALLAEGHEVADGVRFGMAIHAEGAEGDDVMNVERPAMSLGGEAAVGAESGGGKHPPASLTPRWPVVGVVTAKPVRVVLAGTEDCQVLAEATLGATDAPPHSARLDAERLAADRTDDREEGFASGAFLAERRVRLAPPIGGLPCAEAGAGAESAARCRRGAVLGSALVADRRERAGAMRRDVPDVRRAGAGERTVLAGPRFQVAKRPAAGRAGGIDVRGGVRLLAGPRAVTLRRAAVVPEGFAAGGAGGVNAVARLGRSSDSHKAECTTLGTRNWSRKATAA